MRIIKYKIIKSVTTFFSVLTLSLFVYAQEALEITWQDLIPSTTSETQAPLIFKNMGDDRYSSATVEELEGENVRISGYLLPLDYDYDESETKVSEFLLVPFLGACIHVPPPPPNQIVYVKSENNAFNNLSEEDLWLPVTVTGTLETEYTSSDLAAAGYSIVTNDVERYEEPY